MDVSAEDEWAHLTESENKNSKVEEGIGSKIDAGEAKDVQDRSVTFKEKEFKTKEEKYKKRSEDFKDNFGTTAQYLKFVNAHIAEKTSRLDKLRQENEKFEQDIAILNPTSQKTEGRFENSVGDYLHKMDKEDDAIKTIQDGLTLVGSKSEHEKIFDAIGSLILQLNSKNQAALDELNSVKTEFDKMKNDYEKIKQELKQLRGE